MSAFPSPVEPRLSSCRRTSKDSEQSRCSTPDNEGERPCSAGAETFSRYSDFFICSLCEFSCDTAIDFTTHLSYNHHNEDFFFCFHCNYRGSYTTDLTNHFNTHTLGEAHIYRCPCVGENCSYRTDNFHHMRQHLTSHKDCQTLECFTCKSTFTGSTEFLQHAQQNSLTLYTCSKCSSRFQEKAAIQHHWQTKHTGGLMFRVRKILLCYDRKINGYLSSQTSGKIVTKKNRKSVDAHHDKVENLPAAISDTGSKTLENLEVSRNEKSVFKPSESDAVPDSGATAAKTLELSGVEMSVSGCKFLGSKSLSVPVHKSSGQVIDTVSEIPASEIGQNTSFKEPMIDDCGVANMKNSCLTNLPESSENMMGHSSFSVETESSFTGISVDENRPEEENSKILVIDIPDLHESNPSHPAMGDTLETENDYIQKERSLSKDMERPIENHAVALKSLDSHLEDQSQLEEVVSVNADTDFIPVTQMQADFSSSGVKDKEVCKNQTCSDVDKPYYNSQTEAQSSDLHSEGRTYLSSAEMSKREVLHSGANSAEVPEVDGQGMIKLSELFGGDELHRALSDHLCHVNGGQFCCAICDKGFNRRERIHKHLFGHFHVPLFYCFFCSFQSGSGHELMRHLAREHPHQKDNINSLSLKVHRDGLLQTLEQQRPLTTPKFRNICRHLKENRFTSGLESGTDGSSVARAVAGRIEQADIVGDEDAAKSMKQHVPVVSGNNVAQDDDYISVGRLEHSVENKKNKSGSASVTHTLLAEEKCYVSSCTAVSSNRAENYSASSEDVDQSFSRYAHCGVKSCNRSVASHRRKNSEVKTFGNYEEDSSTVAEDSETIHLHRAKTGSCAQSKQVALQNSEMKGKSPARLKRGTYIAVKEGSMIKLKCKFCGEMTLSQSSLSKHFETCHAYIDAQSVSAEPGFAGSPTRNMQTNSSVLNPNYTVPSAESSQKQFGEYDLMKSESQSREAIEPMSSEYMDNSEKPLKRSSLKTFYSGNNSEKPLLENIGKDTGAVSPVSEKSKPVEGLHERALKQTTGVEDSRDAFVLESTKNALKKTTDVEDSWDADSLESSESKTEAEKLKNVQGYQAPVQTDDESVKSSDAQSDVDMSEEDDIPLQKPRKRRIVPRLVISSDEEDSGDKTDSDRYSERSQEEGTEDDLEQMSQCKFCKFAAPSSHVSELQDHLLNMHQQLIKSLIKCGYCGQPYGDLAILKRHINSVHHGKPELQEPMSYHEFFRIQEKENCSPQKRLEQQVNKVRSQPRIKMRRMQKDTDSVITVASDAKNSKSNGESKCADDDSSIFIPGNTLVNKESSDMTSENSNSNASTSGGLKIIARSHSKQNGNTLPISDDETNPQNVTRIESSKGQEHGKVRKFPVLDSSEVSNVFSSKTLCPETDGSSSDAKDVNKTKSVRKESKVSATQNPATALKSRTKEGLADEQYMESGKEKTTSTKRYRCVKCSQVQTDYRSIFLHLSRHLDYSLFHCDKCPREFLTINYAQLHYSKKHAGEPFPHSWVCDPDAEEQLLTLIKDSEVVELNEQNPLVKSAEEYKQSIQCCLCQVVFDSLALFRSHCLKDHEIENNSEKMQWKDKQSQSVYDLNGNVIRFTPALQTRLFNYLCGFCSWRFMSKDLVAAHAREKHTELQYSWIVLLRSGIARSAKSLQTSEEKSATASMSQEEIREAQNTETSSESSRDGLEMTAVFREAEKDSEEQESEDLAGGMDSGRGVSSPKLRAELKIVLEDFLKTEFQRLLQSNGISIIHLGDRLSPEAQENLKKFVPQ